MTLCPFCRNWTGLRVSLPNTTVISNQLVFKLTGVIFHLLQVLFFFFLVCSIDANPTITIFMDHSLLGYIVIAVTLEVCKGPVGSALHVYF